MASDLLAKLKKNSTIKSAAVLTKSDFFNKKDMCPTQVPILNVALSGMVDGGLTSGLTIVAGPSKHYKSNLSLLMASGYMKKYPDAVLILYDSEFGITPEYLRSFNIDPERVLHSPIEHLEQLKFDLTKQLDEIQRGEHVVIVIDSIGNLASKKEVEDALSGSEKADMTRAKVIKSIFRIATPYLTTRDIPLIAINHVYDEMGLYPKQIMSGGTGIYLSASTIFFMGRQQEKDKKTNEVEGYNFVLKIEKSRYVREASKFPINVTWKGGVSKWSGLLEIAEELGWVIKPKQGWYQAVDKNTGEILFGEKLYREKDTNKAEFWLPLMKAGFATSIEERYKQHAVGFTTGEEETSPEDYVEDDSYEEGED